MYSTRSNPYAPTQAIASYQPPLTNAVVLKNWLPNSSYKYTLARISDYLTATVHTATAMNIADGVDTSQGDYRFKLTFVPQQQTVPVIVNVTNFSGIISTAVTINGQLQSPRVSTNEQGQATIDGMDTLVNMGATATQTTNLRLAFKTFAPNASTITIESKSVRHTINQDNNTYTFSVTIDGTSYTSTLVCPNLSSVQLLLQDTQTHKQVFDSGVINSAN